MQDNMTAVKPFLQAIITNLITAVTGDLAGALLHLYKNDYTPNPNTLLADMTEADFSGYVSKVVTWSAVSISDDGHPESIGTALEFRPTSSVITNNIYGAYLTTAGGALRMAWRFASAPFLPIAMASTLDVIQLTPRFRVDPVGGPAVIVS